MSSYEVVVLSIRFFQGTTSDILIIGPLLAQEKWVDKIAPILIIIIFGWILFDILIHAIRVRKEHNLVQQVKDLTLENIPNIDSRSLVGRRCKIVKDKYQSSPDELRESLSAVAALDGNMTDNHYSLTKAFVWILPVLGFIGTAWGMSHAIGGFSDALKETKDIAVLTERLSQLVIPNLAQAFAITIVALTTSIIGHYCTTMVQSWEHEVLNDLDHACVKWLASLPLHSGGKIDQILLLFVQQVDRFNRNFESLLETSEFLREAADKLIEATEEMKNAVRDLKASMNAPYNITITRGKIHE